MERPNLDLQKLRAHFAPHIFERGQTYQRSGEVLNLTLRGNTVSAGVQGSDYKPYRITLTLSQDDLTNAECTCPYMESFGDFCKHIAAVALEYYFWPEHIVSEASVGELLKPLDEDDLRSALEHLLMLYPEAIDALELYLQKAQIQREQVQRENEQKKIERSTSEPNDPPAEMALDTRLFEKMMRTAVRGAGRDWDGFPEYNDVYKVIEEIKPFLERAAYRDALALCEALINAFIGEVNSIEDMYEGIGFSDEWIFDDFDRYLTEAVLGLQSNSRLNRAERKRLLYEVFAWNDLIGNEWTNPSLSMAAHALAEGLETHDEETEELLTEVARLELGKTDRNTYSEIRLRVLRETGRSDEALAFAETTGQGAGYLGVLLEQGKLGQVMAEYRGQIKNEQDALNVVQQLADAHPEEALELAQYGLARATEQEHSAQQDRLRELELEFTETNSERNDRLNLASFTKDLAARLGNHEATLDASLIEFELSASLPRYEALRTLTGTDWPRIQSQLFTNLREADYLNYHASADIFLKEGLPEDAVGVASRFSHDDNLLQKVMGAVIHTHASWVIAAARGKAEPVMDGGRSNYYKSAAHLLGYAKTAYDASGQMAEWKAYITVLRGKHKRKYRLMEALEGL